jgi:hypothetical protein
MSWGIRCRGHRCPQNLVVRTGGYLLSSVVNTARTSTDDHARRHGTLLVSRGPQSSMGRFGTGQAPVPSLDCPSEVIYRQTWTAHSLVLVPVTVHQLVNTTKIQETNECSGLSVLFRAHLNKNPSEPLLGRLLINGTGRWISKGPGTRDE